LQFYETVMLVSCVSQSVIARLVEGAWISGCKCSCAYDVFIADNCCCAVLCRDLAQFRAVAQELLTSAAWQLAGQAAPPQLAAAAAAEAASPVEVEELLKALLAHAAALTATLKAALQLRQDGDHHHQQLSEDASKAAAAAASGPEELQEVLQGLAAGVAALRSAAAAARAPFGWEDGPLVVAMRRGQLLLVDELNLAEDAVLERLNRCGTVLPVVFFLCMLYRMLQSSCAAAGTWFAVLSKLGHDRCCCRICCQNLSQTVAAAVCWSLGAASRLQRRVVGVLSWWWGPRASRCWPR
jgi:hypothetical protein